MTSFTTGFIIPDGWPSWKNVNVNLIWWEALPPDFEKKLPNYDHWVLDTLLPRLSKYSYLRVYVKMSNLNHDKQYQILRLPDVVKTTGLSRSSIYAAISQDIFPKQFHIGPRSVGWLKSEIDEWIEKQIIHSRG
jgi:prophage regulatory protein